MIIRKMTKSRVTFQFTSINVSRRGSARCELSITFDLTKSEMAGVKKDEVVSRVPSYGYGLKPHKLYEVRMMEP